jgi:hypothetical protein
MGAFDVLADNLGLLLFTALSIGVIAYLLYAMVNPSRF